VSDWFSFRFIWFLACLVVAGTSIIHPHLFSPRFAGRRLEKSFAVSKSVFGDKKDRRKARTAQGFASCDKSFGASEATSLRQGYGAVERANAILEQAN
jgi:hypothetical protein